jgi:trehalose 6-phosphate synthase/phosphatase
VVSGRCRWSLERWLGGLPVRLHAEHGLWSRPAGGEGHARPIPPQSWRGPVLGLLREYVKRTPGAIVEAKPAGLAWHYRAVDAQTGLHRAGELRRHLEELLANVPTGLLAGDKVVEVRPDGVHKGVSIPAILRRNPDALLVAIGDDRTDEDLFAALPEKSVSIRVGQAHSRAELRLADVGAVRAFQRTLAEQDAEAAEEATTSQPSAA